VYTAISNFIVTRHSIIYLATPYRKCSNVFIARSILIALTFQFNIRIRFIHSIRTITLRNGIISVICNVYNNIYNTYRTNTHANVPIHRYNIILYTSDGRALNTHTTFMGNISHCICVDNIYIYIYYIILL